MLACLGMTPVNGIGVGTDADFERKTKNSE